MNNAQIRDRCSIEILKERPFRIMDECIAFSVREPQDVSHILSGFNMFNKFNNRFLPLSPYDIISIFQAFIRQEC